MAEKRKEAIATLRELAADCEMSIEELCDLACAPKARTALPPKFRHPKDRSLTWLGRGRRPDWLLTYIYQGGALEDLRI